MFEFGRYTLSYQPPEGAVEAAVDMSISAEADLSEMMGFFETFLQAAGYVIEGKELTLERRAPEFDVPDFPYSFGDTLPGSAGTDTLSLGAPRPAGGIWGGMGNDVITF
jgi:Ca2+-binding RTX toxin-like protein